MGYRNFFENINSMVKTISKPTPLFDKISPSKNLLPNLNDQHDPNINNEILVQDLNLKYKECAKFPNIQNKQLQTKHNFQEQPINYTASFAGVNGVEEPISEKKIDKENNMAKSTIALNHSGNIILQVNEHKNSVYIISFSPSNKLKFEQGKNLKNFVVDQQQNSENLRSEGNSIDTEIQHYLDFNSRRVENGNVVIEPEVTPFKNGWFIIDRISIEQYKERKIPLRCCLPTRKLFVTKRILG